MKKLEQSNTFAFGELNELDANTPGSQAYSNGCEELRGFDLIPGRGVTVGKAPNPANGETLKYPLTHLNGKYFIKNTEGIIGTPGAYQVVRTEEKEISAVPTEAWESGVVYPTLDELFNAAMTAGNYRAAIPAGTNITDTHYNTENYRNYGFLEFDNPSCPVTITSGTYFTVPHSTKIYGAGLTAGKTTYLQSSFIRDDQQDDPVKEIISNPKWGLFVKSKTVRRDNTGGWHVISTDTRGQLMHSHAKQRVHTRAVLFFITEYTTDIDPYTHNLSPGVYQATSDITLVGKGKMFEAYEGQCLVESPDSWIVNIGTHSNYNNVEYREFTAPHVLYGYGTHGWSGADIPQPSEWFQHTKVTTPATPTSLFYFTGQTFTLGQRRFGKADFLKEKGGLGATGFISEWDGNNRTIPATPDASSPYFLSFDSPLLWIEPGYQGIFCGTVNSEYIVGGEQDGPTVKRISANGCPVNPLTGSKAMLLKPSCQLQGVVYYISNFGISTMHYSNEAQTYIPQHFDTLHRRWGDSRPTTLAASRRERCIYVHMAPENTVWKIWPETGGVAQAYLPEDLAIEGVFERSGEVYGLATDGLMYDMAGGVAKESYLRTTAFLRAVDVGPTTTRILVRMKDSFGGQYRIEGQTEWADFEAGFEDTAKGIPFTGTREVFTQAYMDHKHNGKTIEIRSTTSGVSATADTEEDLATAVQTETGESRLTIQGIIVELGG